MADLVTLEQARAQVRSDTTADDTWLTMAISAISGAVLTWLKDEWRAYVVLKDASGAMILDSAGDPIIEEDSNGPVINPTVAFAVLVEIAQQFRFRDGSGAAAVPAHWGHGYVLGAGATSLLAGIRKTTVQ